MRLIPDEVLAAVTIDTEAEGEPYQAKVGVAEVIRNRMQRRYSSDGTVAGTVCRRLQFSAWAQVSPADRANLIRALQSDDSNPAVLDCVKAWAAAQSGSANVLDAVLFYSVRMTTPPIWAEDANFICQLGKLRFFRA